MRSYKSLRTAQLGLKSHLRTTRSLTSATSFSGQHIIAGYDNVDTSSVASNWTTLAIRLGLLAIASIVGTVTAVNSSECEFDDECGVNYETEQHFTNWSSTVSCIPNRVYEPKSAQEVVRVLKTHHDSHKKIRPIGQALSPNGLGMSNNDVISLSAIDYVEIDKERSLVTVGAGAKVSTVLSQLKVEGLTLQNFSSIQEQQIGGWMQVAAHGTGMLELNACMRLIDQSMTTNSKNKVITNEDTAEHISFRT